MLDNINPETDYILAFFPCTYFQSDNYIMFKGKMAQAKNWSIEKKLEYVICRHEELHQNYKALSKLVIACLRNGLHMVIENPSTQPHYLNRFWCIEPSFVDNDRSVRGDKFKKPTQYWFINCEPKNNFIFEPQIVRKTVPVKKFNGCKDRAKLKSEITPEYANRFIREFILDGDYYGV